MSGNPINYVDFLGREQRKGWQAGTVENKSNESVYIYGEQGEGYELKPNEQSRTFLEDTDAVVFPDGRVYKVGSQDITITSKGVQEDWFEKLISPGSGFVSSEFAAQQGWNLKANPPMNVDPHKSGPEKRKSSEQYPVRCGYIMNCQSSTGCGYTMSCETTMGHGYLASGESSYYYRKHSNINAPHTSGLIGLFGITRQLKDGSILKIKDIGKGLQLHFHFGLPDEGWVFKLKHKNQSLIWFGSRVLFLVTKAPRLIFIAPPDYHWREEQQPVQS